MTHATSITPPTNGDMSPYLTPFCSSCGSECWNPIEPSFLYNSMPGLETVSQGAIYTFLYNGGTANFSPGVGPGENSIWYQRAYAASPTAQQSANQSTAPSYMLGPGMPWAGGGRATAPRATSRTGPQPTRTSGARSYNGSQIHYGWYQYMNMQSTAQGIPGHRTPASSAPAPLALWQHDSLHDQPGYTGDVLAADLSQSLERRGTPSRTACRASARPRQVGSPVSAGSSLNLGWSALCVGASGYGEGVCGVGGGPDGQLLHGNNCGNTSSPGASYGGKHNNKNAQCNISAGHSAVGISPDDIGCWNGNGTGAPCSGTGSSIWGWDGQQTVQWNSGGNQYRCWD